MNVQKRAVPPSLERLYPEFVRTGKVSSLPKSVHPRKTPANLVWILQRLRDGALARHALGWNGEHVAHKYAYSVSHTEYLSAGGVDLRPLLMDMAVPVLFFLVWVRPENRAEEFSCPYRAHFAQVYGLDDDGTADCPAGRLWDFIRGWGPHGVDKLLRDNKPETVSGLLDVLAFQRHRLDAVMEGVVRQVWTQLGPIPRYIRARYRSRVSCLFFLPNRGTIWHHTPPRYRLTRGTGYTGLPPNPHPSIWARLLRDVPTAFPPSGATTRIVRFFDMAVWNLHIHTKYSVDLLASMGQKDTSGGATEKAFTRVSPSDRAELLRQVLTFLMPNWKRLWNYMGWPRTPEVQARLMHLKSVGWAPAEADLVWLMLYGK